MHGLEADIACAIGLFEKGGQPVALLQRIQIADRHVPHLLDAVAVLAGVGGIDVDDRVAGRVVDGEAEVGEAEEPLPAS